MPENSWSKDLMETDFYKISEDTIDKFAKSDSRSEFSVKLSKEDILRLHMSHDQLIDGVRAAISGLMSLHTGEKDAGFLLAKSIDELRRANRNFRIVIEHLMQQAIED